MNFVTKSKAKQQKIQEIFSKYSYIFVLQHNSISASNWKSIKKNFAKNAGIRMIPKKFHSSIFGSTIQELFLQKSLVGPLFFFGCNSILVYKEFITEIQSTKLPKYTLLRGSPLALFFHESGKFTYCDFLGISKLLSEFSNFSTSENLSANQYMIGKCIQAIEYQKSILQNTLYLHSQNLLRVLENSKLQKRKI